MQYLFSLTFLPYLEDNKVDYAAGSQRDPTPLPHPATPNFENPIHIAPEAATETIFSNTCSFFLGKTFYDFPRGSFCLSNKYLEKMLFF